MSNLFKTCSTLNKKFIKNKRKKEKLEILNDYKKLCNKVKDYALDGCGSYGGDYKFDHISKISVRFFKKKHPQFKVEMGDWTFGIRWSNKLI